MDWNSRALLRAFLLVGGLLYLGLGIARGQVFGMSLGIVAAALGGFGLWVDWSRQSTGREE